MVMTSLFSIIFYIILLNSAHSFQRISNKRVHLSDQHVTMRAESEGHITEIMKTDAEFMRENH